MPRKYKNDPRTEFKTFRFTAAELTRLENRARARRQGLSAYVRAVLFAKDDSEDVHTTVPQKTATIAPPPSSPVPKEQPGGRISTYVRGVLLRTARKSSTNVSNSAEPVEDYPVTRARRSTASERVLTDQLRRVGTNLNQIAHRMNERRIPPPRELTMALDEIRDLVRQARGL